MASSTAESTESVGRTNATAGIFFVPRNQEPIRAELFGPEHLEAHARCLAAAAQSAVIRTGHPLLRRLNDNARALIRDHRLISAAYRRGETFGSDADWLLDNFHIIADALAEVRVDLPRGYYNLLPKLREGRWPGYLVSSCSPSGWSLIPTALDGAHHEFCASVSRRDAADDRRAVGRADHAAIGITGESAAFGRPNPQAHADRQAAETWPLDTCRPTEPPSSRSRAIVFQTPPPAARGMHGRLSPPVARMVACPRSPISSKPVAGKLSEQAARTWPSFAAAGSSSKRPIKSPSVIA